MKGREGRTLSFATGCSQSILYTKKEVDLLVPPRVFLGSGRREVSQLHDGIDGLPVDHLLHVQPELQRGLRQGQPGPGRHH